LIIYLRGGGVIETQEHEIMHEFSDILGGNMRRTIGMLVDKAVVGLGQVS